MSSGSPTESNQKKTNERKADPGTEDVTFGGVLGTVVLRTEAQEAQLLACEQIIAEACQNFVQAGLALATIRDNRLYQPEYACFEDYCRAKWEDERRYANQLIGAAQLFTYLRAICSLKKPATKASSARSLASPLARQSQRGNELSNSSAHGESQRAL